MRKRIILLLAATSLLSGCGEKQICDHVDEDKNHICDLCKTILSDHNDGDNNHYCDYCGIALSVHTDQNLDGKCDICGKDILEPIEYAEWPTEQIQDLVSDVANSSVIIPAFNKALDIEIDTQDVETDGYFSIYCFSEDKGVETEYLNILKAAHWEVSTEKTNGYYDAYDPSLEVWMNFGYFDDYSDLEICITKSNKTYWPAQKIADALQDMVPGTKTVIPQFEATATYANYYKKDKLLAINGYDFKDTIIEDYKVILANKGWKSIKLNDESKEWNAISPNDDFEIHFYLDSTKTEFNVDVLRYRPPVANWPYEQIASVVAEMGATGEVIPYYGVNTGFEVNTDYYPPAIYIFCDKSVQESGASSYNQALLDEGYINAGDMYGEPYYAKPGTTLAYRATVIVGVLQIELFKLDSPAA